MDASSLSWVDTHAHLEYEYPFDLNTYLENASAKGVRAFVTIGTTLESFEKIKAIAEQNRNIYFTVGIHPHEAVDYTDEIDQKMRELVTHPKCVAVGEIGLDYYYDHSPREKQQEVFKRQLQVALDSGKPIVIHSRDGEEDLLKQLKEYSSKAKDKSRLGIIHCFSGSEEFGKACLDLGFYLSFSGILTFKTAEDIRKTAKQVPIEKALLETDSPFLAPIPFRGKPNQSAYLVETAKILATSMGVSLEELSRQTVKNSEYIFNIKVV